MNELERQMIIDVAAKAACNDNEQVHVHDFTTNVPWANQPVIETAIDMSRNRGAVVHAHWSGPKSLFLRRDCTISAYGVGRQLLPLLDALATLPEEK